MQSLDYCYDTGRLYRRIRNEHPNSRGIWCIRWWCDEDVMKRRWACLLARSPKKEFEKGEQEESIVTWGSAPVCVCTGTVRAYSMYSVQMNELHLARMVCAKLVWLIGVFLGCPQIPAKGEGARKKEGRPRDGGFENTTMNRPEADN